VDQWRSTPLTVASVRLATRLGGELPPSAWRQRREVDVPGLDLDEPLVLGDLSERALDADPTRAQPHDLRHFELRVDLEQSVELAAARQR